MAKNLVFSLGGKTCEVLPTKIDRKKLYGWNVPRALDAAGKDCQAVQVEDESGIVIRKGGSGIGILSPDGKWVERGELKALLADGSPAPLVSSSYDAPIVLEKKASVNDVLNLTVTAFYQLQGEGAVELAGAVGSDIYSFVYNLRADYEGADALLLAKDGVPFLLTGANAEFPFIGLEAAAVIDEAEDDEAESDDIDFSMM
jgi:hypothetical protein